MTSWRSIPIDRFRARTAPLSAPPEVTIAVFLGDKVAGSNPVPATSVGCNNSQSPANPGKAGVFSCAVGTICDALRAFACTCCAAFCAAFGSPFTAAAKCSSVVIRTNLSLDLCLLSSDSRVGNAVYRSEKPGKDGWSPLFVDRNRLSKSKLATDLIQQHKSVLQFVRVISLLWQGARQNIAGISNYFANRFGGVTLF